MPLIEGDVTEKWGDGRTIDGLLWDSLDAACLDGQDLLLQTFQEGTHVVRNFLTVESTTFAISEDFRCGIISTDDHKTAIICDVKDIIGIGGACQSDLKLSSGECFISEDELGCFLLGALPVNRIG